MATVSAPASPPLSEVGPTGYSVPSSATLTTVSVMSPELGVIVTVTRPSPSLSILKSNDSPQLGLCGIPSEYPQGAVGCCDSAVTSFGTSIFGNAGNE